jgi:hypothetical protein
LALVRSPIDSCLSSIRKLERTKATGGAEPKLDILRAIEALEPFLSFALALAEVLLVGDGQRRDHDVEHRSAAVEPHGAEIVVAGPAFDVRDELALGALR